MDNSILWNKILERAQFDLSSLIYNSWFAETKLFKFEDGLATIIVPYAYCILRLEETYKDYIKSLFNDEVGESPELKFVLEEDVVEEPKEIKIEQKEEVKEEKDNTLFKTNLNEEYTFDSFVVGNCNKLAYTAAKAVADNPGELYNPLFIYGNSGLGKTHLMHAIGNHIVEHTNKKVLYVTSDDFVKEYTRIVNKSDNYENMDIFRNKYRDIDILMIDDIQRLENAPSTRNEFFTTFNNLHNDKKQIIISSDRSPNDLKMFEDRLKTRFTWGLTVDIYPPDIETKRAIIKKKIENENLQDQIDEDIIEYMASKIGTDIREIEGSIKRLLIEGTMNNGIITLELAQEALKNIINNGFSEDINKSRIERVVADNFKISIDDLKSKKRSANIAYPRQITMYLIRKITDEPFDSIGKEFGGKDHSTVIHACSKIESELATNEELKKLLDKMETEIKS